MHIFTNPVTYTCIEIKFPTIRLESQEKLRSIPVWQQCVLVTIERYITSDATMIICCFGLAVSKQNNYVVPLVDYSYNINKRLL